MSDFDELDLDAAIAQARQLRAIRREHGVEIMLCVAGGMTIEDALATGGVYLYRPSDSDCI